MIAEMTNPALSVSAKIGIVTTRIIVPLWLSLGAVLKLIDGSPSHLPSVLVKNLGGNGFDLLFVLQFSIAVELIARYGNSTVSSAKDMWISADISLSKQL